MLAISTYTEPVPVSDLPQLQPIADNREDDEEQVSFAELLAGLLHNSEEVSEYPSAVSPAEFAEVEEITEFDFFKETLLFEKDAITPVDTKVPEETNILAGTQRLFSDLETIASEANEGEFYKELSNLIKTDLNPEADVNSNLLNAESKKIDISQSTTQNAEQNEVQTVQAAQSVNETIGETQAKKDKNSKTSIVSENTDLKTDKNDQADARLAALRDHAENQKLSKLDEMRANRNRRGNVSFEVNDMRTDQNRLAAAETNGSGVGRVNETSSVRELTLELRLPQQEQNNAIHQANTSWEAKSSGALENLLARELHQSFNGDIVRHASMALRDGGEGTIKIALKPESLGNVKIALELADNKITGKIFVESEEALNAFRKEVASLEQAFKDSGFAAANLDLSLTSQGQNAEEWDKSSFIHHIAASRYDDNSDRIEIDSALNIVNVFIGQRKSSINMLA